MATFTSQNAAQAIVKLVAPMALDALVGNLNMGNLVNRDFEPSLASAGDQVNIAIPPVLTTNNIAEGGTVSAQAPSLGNAQITLNYHQEASFILPDVTRAIAVPDLIKTLMMPAINAIGEKVETDLLALYPNFTVNSATGGSSTMDEARIDSAETTLFGQKVPKNQPKFLIVSGTAYGQLRQLAVFRDWNNLGPSGQPSPIVSAMLPGGQAEGKIKDFFVYRSQFVAKPSSTTYNLAFAKDAIGLVVRRLPLPMPGTGVIGEYAEIGNFGVRVLMSYAPNSLAQQFTVDVLYGCGVLRNSFGVQVQSN
jgi:P22 coat protein - gene protein 5